MAQTIMEITTAIEHIDAMNQDVENLKAEDAAGEVDIDVEIVVEDEPSASETEAAPETTETSEEPKEKE